MPNVHHFDTNFAPIFEGIELSNQDFHGGQHFLFNKFKGFKGHFGLILKGFKGFPPQIFKGFQDFEVNLC